MKEFKAKLEKQLKLNTLICCLFPSVLILCKQLFKNRNDFAQGLVFGVCTGVMVVAVYFLVKNYTVLHDEEKLKKLYIEVTDERNIAITKESLKTSSTISMVVIALASIVSGFFKLSFKLFHHNTSDYKYYSRICIISKCFNYNYCTDVLQKENVNKQNYPYRIFLR